MNLFDFNLTLPITDPTWVFFLVLIIILFAPMILGRLHIPHIIGMILAGVLIGEHGFHVLDRDSSFELFGKVGLYYIMFLAGLEMDMEDFKKNRTKSIVFGWLTFLIPMGLGIWSSMSVLGYGFLTAVLLASMYASHTLIAYPIISRYGLSRLRSVNITIGGTAVTVTLALIILAVIGGMFKGTVDGWFWGFLVAKVAFLGFLIVFFFPRIGRWFFRKYDDSVMQFVFVLAMVFLGAFLAQLAGLEAIIGSFLAGLALNRLIPATSPLMNRVEFVGNAIFIPFFLLSVGMLIDYRAFFTSFETIKVGAVMIVVATAAKFIAAWLTQKTFRMSVDQRRVIFGLSNAQAAATLAAVLVGYNVILGTTPDGEPIRLLNESVLNGTILMILVTCTMASFSAQKGAHNIAMEESTDVEEPDRNEVEILIPVSNQANVEELVNLGLSLKPKRAKNGLHALTVVDDKGSDGTSAKRSKRLLQLAVETAAATDTRLQELLRYDLSPANAISGVIRECGITDVILGLHERKDISSGFLGRVAEGTIADNTTNVFIYKPAQPLSTVKRHLVVLPPQAEKEAGFLSALERLANVVGNTGAKAVFYAAPATLDLIRERFARSSNEIGYVPFVNWEDFLIVSRDVRTDDTLWIWMSRRNGVSYESSMARVSRYLDQYFKGNNFVLVYPLQASIDEGSRYLT